MKHPAHTHTHTHTHTFPQAEQARQELKTTQDDLDEAVKTGREQIRQVEEATRASQVQLAKLNAELDSSKRRLARLDEELGEERTRLAAEEHKTSAAEQAHQDAVKHVGDLEVQRQKLLGKVAKWKHRVARYEKAHSQLADDEQVRPRLSQCLFVLVVVVVNCVSGYSHFYSHSRALSWTGFARKAGSQKGFHRRGTIPSACRAHGGTSRPGDAGSWRANPAGRQHRQRRAH